MSESSTNDPNPPPPALASAQERQWAMFGHLSVLLGGIVTAGWAANIGFFIGPLAIWLLKRDTMPFVADQAKEALNFSLLVTGIFVILMALGLLTLGIGFLITMPIMVIVGIAALILTIIAAMKANEGIRYRYPFNIRFIK